jgi:hypothetical protein
VDWGLGMGSDSCWRPRPNQSKRWILGWSQCYGHSSPGPNHILETAVTAMPCPGTEARGRGSLERGPGLGGKEVIRKAGRGPGPGLGELLQH